MATASTGQQMASPSWGGPSSSLLLGHSSLPGNGSNAAASIGCSSRKSSSATISSSDVARRWTNWANACLTPPHDRSTQQDHRDLRAQDQQALSRQAANRDRRHGPAQP